VVAISSRTFSASRRAGTRGGCAMLLAVTLPARSGPPPATQQHLPHSQLDQQPADPGLQAELARRAFGLPGVVEAPSAVSVPGARALMLADGSQAGPPEAFMVEREFAHLHPAPDQSLHLALPADEAAAAIGAGWAEHHYLVRTGTLPPTIVMVFAPRDAAELEVVWELLQASHRFATTSP
jgi:hypothetical protein